MQPSGSVSTIASRRPIGCVGSSGDSTIATESGADLLVPDEGVAAVRERLLGEGAQPIAEDAAEIARVEAGRPRIGHETGPQTMPAEAGLEARAVSFTKGCYIGQEPVARLHHKGRPNRHLRRLRASSPLAAGDPVTTGVYCYVLRTTKTQTSGKVVVR